MAASSTCIRWAKVITVAVLLFQSSCGRPERDLPNGYTVVRTNGYTVIVTAPDGSDKDIVIGRE